LQKKREINQGYRVQQIIDEKLMQSLTYFIEGLRKENAQEHLQCTDI